MAPRASSEVAGTRNRLPHLSLQHLGAPVLLLVILAGFYWRLVLTYQFDWLSSPDIAMQVLPWFEEDARQMHSGHLPTWDPHTWGGQPLLAQAQPGGAYPLNWILFRWPLQHGHINVVALQWYYVLERWMAALFCYLLCRDLGCSRTASIVGGLIFALSSYIGNTDWPQMVNGALWAPLILMFALRVGRGDRPLASSALCGLFWGVSWLSGHHQAPLFTSLTVAGVWLYYILRSGRINWRVARYGALAVALMGLVGAFQTLPASEYGHLAKRWVDAGDALGWNQVVPYYVHQRYSMKLWSLVGIVYPGLHQNADPFLGVVAFTLAMIGVATAWKEHAVKIMGAVAIGGLIYSLGANSVFQGLLYAVVPTVEKARTPSMSVFIWSLGAAALAAFGVDRVGRLRESVWGGRFAAGLLAFGLFTWGLMLAVMFANHVTWPNDDRVGISALCAVLLAALLYAWRTGNLGYGPAGALVVCLLLLELGNSSGMTFGDRANADQRQFLDRAWGSRDVADFLNAQPKPFRVGVQEDVLAPNWAEYYDLDTIQAYGASVLSDFREVEFFTPQSKKLLNQRYSVGRQPQMPGEQTLFEGANGVKVFYYPDAFPRAWAVHEIVALKSKDEGRSMVTDHLDELRSKAMMLQPALTLPACSGNDQVNITRYSPERVGIRANMTCDGMVVLSDNYYPGWKAMVDGKASDIHEVNLTMRGVLVPAGSHEVQFVYRPARVFAAGAITAIGMIGACVLVYAGRRRAIS
ncbi:MAG TPA: YfhO family protein [Bryobacteraceae bacterium]|nr:YfhO family protein [Bryobacteraceae bacterium]